MKLGQLSDIDIRLLRVFKAVVDSGGFAAAEVMLNVSRSAISQRMADLERRLGATLCRRGRSGFELTPSGQVVYDAVLQLFSAIENFRTQINSSEGDLRGQLNIGITDNLVTSPHMRMTKALRILRSRGRNIHIHVRMTAPNEVERGVLDGRFHMGAVPASRPVEGLEYSSLYSETSYLYCSSLHPLFADPRPALGDAGILEHDAVTLSRPQGEEAILRAQELRVKATSSDREGVAFLILSGEYIGYLPSHYAERWVSANRLRALVPERLHYETQYCVITRAGAADNVILAAYLSALDTVALLDPLL